MVKMSSIIVCSCAAALVLGCSVSLAEDRPKESVQFNYGKIEYQYNTQQRDVSTGQATGKRQHKPITVIKETDKSSPNLMMRKSGGDPGIAGKQFNTTTPLTNQGPLGGTGGAGSAGSKVKLPATAK
jgi:type VI protein secretion system component Hcp